MQGRAQITSKGQGGQRAGSMSGPLSPPATKRRVRGAPLVPPGPARDLGPVLSPLRICTDGPQPGRNGDRAGPTGLSCWTPHSVNAAGRLARERGGPPADPAKALTSPALGLHAGEPS